MSDERLGVRVELTQTVPAAPADLRATALAAWHVRLELFFAACALPGGCLSGELSTRDTGQAGLTRRLNGG